MEFDPKKVYAPMLSLSGELLYSKRISSGLWAILYKASSYAKRWAAKEACSKALGIGLRMGISWKEMHVTNLKSGKPILKIEGKAQLILKKITPKGRKTRIHVSLTDDYPWAKALVMIEAI